MNVLFMVWLAKVVGARLSPLDPLNYYHPLCREARRMVENDRPAQASVPTSEPQGSTVSAYAAELEGLPGHRLAHYAGAHLLIPGINPLGGLPAWTFEVPVPVIPIRVPIPAY